MPTPNKKPRTSYAAQILAELEIDLDEVGLTDDLVPPETSERLRKAGIEITPQSVMMHQAIARAMITGDVETIKLLRDTVGEKPSDQLELGGILDKPLASIDMSKLSDDELKALIEHKTNLLQMELKEEK